MGTVMKIERNLSMEKEPRTLSVHQIQCAREAALEVLSTKTMEEALSIFIEGLQPVIYKNNEGKMEVDDADSSDFISEHKSFLLLEEFRDIVSAPF